MARLLDHLLRHTLPNNVRDSLLKCTVIDAQNIYEYLDTSERGGVIDTANLPNCAPPLVDMFIEYRAKVVNNPKRMTLGWQIHAVEKSPQAMKNTAFMILDPDLDARWTLYGTLYEEQFGTIAYSSTIIGSHGEVRPVLEIFKGQTGILPFSIEPRENGPLWAEYQQNPFNDTMKEITFSMNVVLYALCFMHTKNVVQETISPPPKLSKAHQKKYKRPLLTYKVLKIKPVGSKSTGQGGEHVTPSLHIRRGHFKTFTADRPLFGKWTGQYWWYQALVGDAKRGQVMKDYEPTTERNE